jgi:hypothetical protein
MNEAVSRQQSAFSGLQERPLGRFHSERREESRSASERIAEQKIRARFLSRDYGIGMARLGEVADSCRLRAEG